MILIIVRHGETEENSKDIIQGHMNGSITKRGIMQARKTARALARYKADVIFSSDLERAAKTAGEIARFQKAEIHYSKLLRERKVGDFEGKKRSEFHEYRRAHGFEEHSFRPSGGENYADVKRRVLGFMKRLSKRYENSTVIIVTHGVVVRALVSAYAGVPLRESPGIKVRNAGWIAFKVNEKGKAVEMQNELFEE